jgi:hypothetical protein
MTFSKAATGYSQTLAAIYILDRVVEMITLDNIEQFTIPLQDHSAKWIFETENKQLPSAEHLDQIFPLTEEASRFLWDFQSKIRINSFYPDVNKYFRDVEKFTFGENMESQVKKWLYQRGLPFKDKVQGQCPRSTAQRHWAGAAASVAVQPPSQRGWLGLGR